MMLVLVVVSLLALSSPVKMNELPFDCEDIYNNGFNQSGVYNIYPTGANQPLQVYCELGCDEFDDGNERWTVIQRRIDGYVNFYKSWDEYKNGFGNVSGEYWLGLQNMFVMTFANRYELRVDMTDFQGGSAYAKYTTFSVDPESNNYMLTVGGYINGGAGDCLYYSSGRGFATYDQDLYGCADAYNGGFWYSWWPCLIANPNGQYKNMPNVPSYTGISWVCWKGYNYSLKTIQMKIRRLPLEDILNS